MKEFILKHIGELIFTGISGVLTAAYRSLSKRIKAQEEERKAVKEGLLAIMHDRLYQSCTFYIKQGSIDTGGLKKLRIPLQKLSRTGWKWHRHGAVQPGQSHFPSVTEKGDTNHGNDS